MASERERQTSVLLVGALLLTLVVGCAPSPSGPVPAQDSLVVATTFFPIYDIARSIAKDRAQVFTLIPANVEPHDYEPSPSDLIRMQDAQLFLTLGLEFAPLERRFDHPNTQTVVLSQDIPLIYYFDPHDPSTSQPDPHVWLSPRNMMVMAQKAQDALAKAAPNDAAFFADNAAQLQAQLERIDGEYASLADCPVHTLVTTHAAFSYLARDYNLTLISIAGLSPDAQPSPSDLKNLVDAVRNAGVSVIFTERFVDPRIASTIAAEVGAKLLVLDPIESAQASDTYISLMEKNLVMLKEALRCGD